MNIFSTVNNIISEYIYVLMKQLFNSLITPASKHIAQNINQNIMK